MIFSASGDDWVMFHVEQHPITAVVVCPRTEGVVPRRTFEGEAGVFHVEQFEGRGGVFHVEQKSGRRNL